MVSRETGIQAAFVALAFALFVAGIVLVPDLLAAPASAAVWIVVFYGIAFGGSHLYLYVTDQGDAIPRSARARFLVALGLVLPLWGVATVGEEYSIGDVGVPIAVGVITLVVFGAYFVNEMRHGYAESQSTAGSR